MHRHLCQILKAPRVCHLEHNQVRTGEPKPANAPALDAGDPGSDLAESASDLEPDPRDETFGGGGDQPPARPSRGCGQDRKETAPRAPEVLPRRF